MQDFEKKVEEINEYFLLVRSLENIQDIGELRISPSQSATLKANCYLLLYNLIEGSVVAGVDEIFSSINQQNATFEKFTNKYKQKWLNYASALVSRDDQKTKATFGTELSEIFSKISSFNVIPYKDKNGNLFEKYSGFLKNQGIGSEISGNLDIRKIKDLAKLYDFRIPSESYDEENRRLPSGSKDKVSEEGKNFLKIKTVRNKLAHGEDTFSAVGRSDSLEDIQKIKDSIVPYLKKLLENIDAFIRGQGYLEEVNC